VRLRGFAHAPVRASWALDPTCSPALVRRQAPCLAKGRQALLLAAPRRLASSPPNAWCCRLGPARAWRRGPACVDMQSMRASFPGQVCGVCKFGSCAGRPPVLQVARPGRRGALRRARPARARSDLHQSLRMTVAIPLLNGVPPESEFLRCAPAALRLLPDLFACRGCSARPARTPHAPRPCSSSWALLRQVRHCHGRRLCGEGRDSVELLLRAARKQPSVGLYTVVIHSFQGPRRVCRAM